ncbi:MAG: glucoamylase [Armatimonadetes bacterium]|nr:glucoamylase [Armatimonadota bacterium]
MRVVGAQSNPVQSASPRSASGAQIPNLPNDRVGSAAAAGTEVNLARVLKAAVDEGPAPQGPGGDAHWTNANKDGVGTSAGRDSKVWFTLGEGRLTEVYYPTLDQANTTELKFIVSDGESFSVFDDKAGTTRVEAADDQALAFRYVTEDAEHGFKLSKTYITDPDRNTVVMKVELQSTRGKPLDLYVVHDPAIRNSGMHDRGCVKSGAMVAKENGVASALASSNGYQEINIGFKDRSDGVRELLSQHGLSHHYSSAADGNVVQVGKIASGTVDGQVTLALGFGSDSKSAVEQAAGSLQEGFSHVFEKYVGGWHEYVGSLRHFDTPYQKEFERAAMTLKAHEDKTYPGAMIASITVPWGHERVANDSGEGGYHLVWSRDLYQVATAFKAMGDEAAANRALDYIFNVQQRPDGSVPQNSWLDGRPYWTGLQMDQVAFPLVLAHELGRVDAETYNKHVKPAAEFIQRHGPSSPQERWEEQSGLSPSTVAAEVAGLVCAADIAEKNGDAESAQRWRATADNWVANLEKWLVTTNGPHGDGQYYLRINDNLDPNDGHKKDMKNGGGSHDERLIVDAGFLDLVRLGIKSADDPLIKKSLQVVDQVIRVETPNGPGFYRYNHDGYGEHEDGRGFVFDGIGRLWPLLNGERAEYHLAAGEVDEARKQLDTMVAFSNAGGMFPEQVWDKPTNSPGMNFGRAVDVLNQNLDTVDMAAGIGQKDGLFGKLDLEAVSRRSDLSRELRDAASFFLADQARFDELDTASKKADKDGLVGKWDLEAARWVHRDDLPNLVTGEGTGSATPLAWTTAQFIRLVANLSEGRNTDTPEVVAQRYLH